MGNDSNPVQATQSGNTTIGSAFLMCISVNKVLAGTVVIKDGSTTVGTLAIGTVAADYHNLPNGGRYGNLVVTLSTSDDVTIYWKKA